MTSNVQSSASPGDMVKLALAVLILAAGIYGFYWLDGQVYSWVRVLGLLAVVGVAAVVALLSGPGKDFWAFMGAARNEIRKVVWPTRQETVQTTLVVVVVTIIVGLFLWLLDWIFASLVRLMVMG